MYFKLRLKLVTEGNKLRAKHSLLTLWDFTYIISFTTVVKEGLIVKLNNYIYKNLFLETFSNISAIKRCEILNETINGFNATINFNNNDEQLINVHIINRAYPKQIKEIIEKNNIENDIYKVIMAPYISDVSAEYCEKSKFGFIDESGNSFINTQNICIIKKGNKNQKKEKSTMKTIFDPSYIVSSKILRVIMQDVSKVWKLKYLANELKCSIGQVYKVKNYLCEQLWAEMSDEGLAIINPEEIMKRWSNDYNIRSIHSLYTLDTINNFENKIKNFVDENKISCVLTGLSGGVRYAPVVRYNKINIIMYEKNYNDFKFITDCKEVETGANINVIITNDHNFFVDSRNINGYMVASPVQVYLDCMVNQGRGEEMAEEILKKEIIK